MSDRPAVTPKKRVAEWRCIDCQKTVFYCATKGGNLLMYTCPHVNPDTGVRCNAQHKIGREKSAEFIARFLETGAIIDLNKEKVITNVRTANLNREPRPEPRRAAGGGGNYLADLYPD